MPENDLLRFAILLGVLFVGLAWMAVIAKVVDAFIERGKQKLRIAQIKLELDLQHQRNLGSNVEQEEKDDPEDNSPRRREVRY